MSIIDLMLIIFMCILLYRYLKGSVAFYIVFGLLVVYFVSIFLQKLGFQFLSDIINQTTKYGLIIIAIIFQPELRSILLSIGNNRIAKQLRLMKNRLMDNEVTDKNKKILVEIIEALKHLSQNYIGGSIILFESGDISNIIKTGIPINGEVSSKLIESIFVKESPLHDGAIVIQEGVIKAASCILPISDKSDINKRIGLRHKSAIGITEVSNSLSIVVSETTGKISYAKEGRLYMDKSIPAIASQINLFINT